MTSTSAIEQSFQTFSLDYGQNLCNKNSHNMAFLKKLWSQKQNEAYWTHII